MRKESKERATDKENKEEHEKRGGRWRAKREIERTRRKGQERETAKRERERVGRNGEARRGQETFSLFSGGAFRRTLGNAGDLCCHVLLSFGLPSMSLI